MIESPSLASYVQFDTKHIPDELAAVAQWVAWQPVWQEERGKVDKIPLNPRTGLAGSIHDPANRMRFGVAVEYARANGFGIGFVFTDDDPFTGVDVDHCIVDGKLNDTANDILAELQSYADVSPSGTGLRVIVRGPHPGGRKSNVNAGVEMYANGRFLTITGRHIAGTPFTITENASGLAVVHARYLAPATKQAGPTPPPTPAIAATDEVERVRDALGRLASWRADDYGEWVRIGHAIKQDMGDAGFSLWDEWSRQSAKYDPEDARQRWAKLEPTGEVSISTVFGAAKEDDPTFMRPAAELAASLIFANGTGPEAAEEPGAVELAIPEDMDPKRWALANVDTLAKLDKTNLARVLLELEERGVSGRFVDGRLLPALREKRKETAGDDGPSIWASIQEDLRELGYTVRLNDLDESIEVNMERMTDSLEAVIQMEMLDRGRTSAEWTRRGIVATARLYRYNPIHEFLESLQWDGRDRIAELERYIRDIHPRIEYENGNVLPVFGAWLRRWGIGAVAKAWGQETVAAQNPVLVFVGGQNLGKSTLARWLCPMGNDFYLESPINPDDKDHLRYAATKLVWEIAELGATTRKADREALKSFLTRSEVTIRPAYARNDIRKTAVCSFIGTINPEIGFLNDPTGNRRFLPVELTEIKHAYYGEVDPVQLWAQFAQLYRDGETWKLTPEEFVMAQTIRAGHEVEQPMAGFVLKYFDVEAGDSATMSTADIVEILRSKGATEANTTNVGLALRALGLIKLETKRPVMWAGIRPRPGVVIAGFGA